MKYQKSSVIFHDLPELPYVSAVTGSIVRNDFPVHVHNGLCLGLSIKGGRIIRMLEREIIVPQGGVFVIPPNMPHSCTTDPDYGHSYRIMVIQPEFIKKIFSEISPAQAEVPAFECGCIDDACLKELVEDFFSSIDQEEETLKLAEIACEITARLCLEHARSGRIIEEKISGEACVTKAVNYIEKNWDQPIFLEKLGKESGMSQYHLIRVFTRVMGITPHAYLLQARIRKAVAFLSDGMALANVAAMTGFTDQSHFTKVFKRQVGISPGVFQEINRD